MQKLSEFRKEFDKIDDKIATFYIKRLALCRDVAIYKSKNNIPILDIEREKRKLKSLETYADTDFKRYALSRLYQHILLMSKKYQHKILGNEIESNKINISDVGEGMQDKLKDLILYKDIFDEETKKLLKAVREDKQEKNRLAFKLIDLSERCGFEGDLWHCFITFSILYSENPYSGGCELNDNISDNLKRISETDFEILREIFFDDFFGKEWEAELKRYIPTPKNRYIWEESIRREFLSLVKSLEKSRNYFEFRECINQFYIKYGFGDFAFNKAFRIDDISVDRGFLIEPIYEIENIHFEDIFGYESQKKKLIENTKAFLNNKPFNNILLFGDSGTGKSSSIKALVNTYYGDGLRCIEIYKHQFKHIPEIIDVLRDRRYKYLIFMDDLSFEDFELEYKYLKAVLEGGMGKKPDNIVIYATSNRRHLIRESFKDKEESDKELHRRDTVEEKLSLAARFGISIYYGSPDKREFNDIVKALAKKYNIGLDEELLLLEANKWELLNGGLSGRTAKQFIDYLLGKKDINQL